MNPQLSVIIASISGAGHLELCLDALRSQRGDIRAEVIVADRVGRPVVELVERKYPEVRLIRFDDPQSVPALRGAGILASHGDIVAITEDHCIPDTEWYQSLVAAHRNHQGPAIGGAVDNGATDRVIDWAVYFCEYSNFMSPVPAGVVHDLPGPNVSYKRSELMKMEEMLRDGYWETFLHWRLESEGHELWSDPTINVIHQKSFEFPSFFAERFHYGRAFAGTRNETVSPGRRLFYLIFSPLLPPILMLRIARRVLGRGRRRREFVMSLPYIAAFMLAWAAGEWVGYAFGPGESALQLT